MKFKQIPTLSQKVIYQVRKINFDTDETLLYLPALIDGGYATVYEGEAEYDLLGFSANRNNYNRKIEEVAVPSNIYKSLDYKSMIHYHFTW